MYLANIHDLLLPVNGNAFPGKYFQWSKNAAIANQIFRQINRDERLKPKDKSFLSAD